MADILKFDNSYSWARSKEVFYSVKLFAPSVELQPKRCPLPVLHIDVERKEAESLEWLSCFSHTSSEDEFFDCVQEQEMTRETDLQMCEDSISLNRQETISTCVQKETLSVLPRLHETISANLQCAVCCRLENHGRHDLTPDKSRTFYRPQTRQIITGTSISTQV